jgi:type VII secretion protein EccB
VHTRRDQVKAYRFLQRRVGSAVLAADPNAPEQPMRRLFGAALASIVVTVVAVAGVAAYGLMAPGHATAWRGGGSLIVEKETSTRYVYVDGVLHPVLNWASARLILGASGPGVVRVSARSLAGVPRGLPVGIPGAPDELPGPQRLRRGPWTLCSQLAPTSDGAHRTVTVLNIGWAPAEPALADDQALLVEGMDDVRYLIWQRQRWPVASAAVVNALGMAAVQPVPVGAALLNTIGQGRTLAPVSVRSAGSAGPTLAGRGSVIGQVYVVGAVNGSLEQYYLLTPDGLAPLTQAQAAVQLAAGNPAWYPGGTVTPIRLSAAEAALVPVTKQIEDDGIPARLPQPVPTSPERAQVCAAYDTSAPAAQARTMTVRDVEALSTVVSGVEPVGPTGGPLADVVSIEPGSGALVRAETSPGSTSGTTFLVTDLGLKYPIADSTVLASLGYSGVVPLPVPVAFVDLMRTGPVLSASAAQQEQAVAATPG